MSTEGRKRQRIVLISLGIGILVLIGVLGVWLSYGLAETRTPRLGFISEKGEHVILANHATVRIYDQDGDLGFRIAHKGIITGSSTAALKKGSEWFAYVESVDRYWFLDGAGDLVLYEFFPKASRCSSIKVVRQRLLDEMPLAVRQRLPEGFIEHLPEPSDVCCPPRKTVPVDRTPSAAVYAPSGRRISWPVPGIELRPRATSFRADGPVAMDIFLLMPSRASAADIDPEWEEIDVSYWNHERPDIVHTWVFAFDRPAGPTVDEVTFLRTLTLYPGEAGYYSAKIGIAGKKRADLGSEDGFGTIKFVLE